MTTLWPGLLLLSLIAMLFVLVPLWRYRNQAARSALAQRREKNQDVFRQRQLELEQDLQQGLTTPEEHTRLLAELQRAFLLDMQALEGQDTGRGARAGGKPVLIALALLVPLVSSGIYYFRGAGPDLALPELFANLAAVETEEAQTAALGDLAAALDERFQRRPNDIQNGYYLGTLYLQLERYPEAIATFEKLLAQMENTPDRAAVLGQLAQAQYMQDGSEITPAVQAIVDEALLINPNESAIMSILAVDAFLREDIAGALAYWRRQLSDVTPGSPQAQTLLQRIAMVEEYLPAEQAGEGAEPAAAVDTSNSITVVIDIAPEMAEQLNEFQSLFVYARNPAMPMPVLAQNLTVPEFPFTITLDNTMTMMGATLESVPQLVVGARLSRTGVATAQAGDLQATLSDPFAITELDAPIELLIDEVVP